MPAPDMPVQRRALLLSDQDHVAVAITPIGPGEHLHLAGVELIAASAVPMGHKIAIRPIAAGEQILKHGVPIGSATRDIGPGEHVHTHNLKSDYLPTFERGAGRPEATSR